MLRALPFTHTYKVSKTLQDRKRSGFPLYLFALTRSTKLRNFQVDKKDAAAILNANPRLLIIYNLNIIQSLLSC